MLQFVLQLQKLTTSFVNGSNMIRVVLNDEKVTLLGHIFDGDYPVDPIVILTSMRPHFRNGKFHEILFSLLCVISFLIDTN